MDVKEEDNRIQAALRGWINNWFQNIGKAKRIRIEGMTPDSDPFSSSLYSYINGDCGRDGGNGKDPFLFRGRNHRPERPGPGHRCRLPEPQESRLQIVDTIEAVVLSGHDFPWEK